MIFTGGGGGGGDNMIPLGKTQYCLFSYGKTYFFHPAGMYTCWTVSSKSRTEECLHWFQR